MVQIQFTPFPELATARFRLRQLMKDDENEIFALRSDDFINQYLDRPKANTLDDARNFISKITDGIAKNEAIFWVVTPRDEARFLGTICLWKISREEAKAEIGFELLPENHGKGIMQDEYRPGKGQVVTFFNLLRLPRPRHRHSIQLRRTR